MNLPPFAEAWKTMEARGYRYGSDALESVRTGYALAECLLAEGCNHEFTPAEFSESGERVSGRTCRKCGAEPAPPWERQHLDGCLWAEVGSAPCTCPAQVRVDGERKA